MKYSYVAGTTDPNGDQLFYMWDWGDDTPLSWIGPYNSGQNVTTFHIWTEKGTYNIKVKAKDTTGAVSDWSDAFPVTMPYSYTKPIPSFIELLLQRFLNAFLLLQHMIG